MESGERPPVFPYGILWEELGTHEVSFENLAKEADTYRTLFDVLRRLDGSTPYVDDRILAEIVAPFGLDEAGAARLADDMFLIAGWYLEPQQRAWMRADLASTRRTLQRVAVLARDLDDALSRLNPKAAVALTFVRGLEPEALDPSEDLSTIELCRTLHDLALSAERMFADTKPDRAGRKTDHIRNTALRLATAATERATGERVTISRGTKYNPDPHFVGKPGEFVWRFFQLIAPGMSERILVQALERLRRASKA